MENNIQAKALYELLKSNPTNSTDETIDVAKQALKTMRLSKLSPLGANAALMILGEIGKELDSIIQSELESGKDVN